MKNATLYLDTRDPECSRPAFSETIVKGIAPSGGLFVPEALPELTLPEILVFADMPYWRRAASVFTRFGVDMSSDRIDALMKRAYGAQWDDERIAPVIEVTADMHVLELWHGPTSAFKDMALQCMPLLFSESVDQLRARGSADEDYLILVATSGDTGKAALEGFADRDHTNIIVFYPADGVSDIQRKQMVTQHGDNVGVFSVRGNFDDCQSAVKAAFADKEFNAELESRHNLRLSSANSINWGRLMPQIVYYISAYADMVASGGVKAGEPMDVCVPTGNFGNILGAYYAKLIGVPIGRLMCASNENNVLTDFIATGVYDISDRDFVNTPSPSMDILISSNLERLLHHLAGPEKVRDWMKELASKKRFQVDRDTFYAMRESFSGDFVTNDESLQVIKRVHEESGYLMDPHTAVAWEVAERLRGEDPVLVVSTAHWAKFGTDVHRALSGLTYSDNLPASVTSLSGVELLGQVQELAGGCACVPKALAELDSATERFADVVDAGREGIEGAVRGWLG
ncbi:MAG: threonine synthase [Actinomycetota bacterium]|jgi:threonine synthase|nr:threonine synthase [Actinomycetota bacterium]